MSPVYATPSGYTSCRPIDYPPFDRAALMGRAHATAKRLRAQFASYREALAYGLGAAHGTFKSNREIASLRAQVAPVHHTAAQIAASRAATRRTGSSLWAS